MEKETTGQERLRPPIVAVLGHVDHGKTTLLDAIRKTDVAKKEAGGITQGIGASMVVTKDGKGITFIDTPGHAAFKNMRSRGAKAADIAILVVAAEEGVKPQTKEALEYILDADIPYIVAATKIDLPSASVEIVQAGLEKEGVLFEGRGGDVPLVPVSARAGKGIDELLEMISLVAELNDVKGDANSPLEAVVVETSKDNRGPLASVVVRNGTLRVGDGVATQNTKTKIRGLFGDKGQNVKEAKPGEPVQILGFSDLPAVGSKLWTLSADTQITEVKEAKPIKRTTLEGEIKAVVKAQNTGSLEAVLSNLPEQVTVLYSGVGDINESDVFIAKSSDAAIFSFETKIPTQVKKLAENEDVKIFSFSIIYELFEKIDEIIKSGITEILGKAEIIAEFPFNNQRVAGCKVLSGNIKKSDSILIYRNEKQLGKAKVITIKKLKQEVNQVGQGEECGIIFIPSLGFQVSDTINAIEEL